MTADDQADLAGLSLAIAELSGMLLDEAGLNQPLQRVADLSVGSVPGRTGAGVTLLRADCPGDGRLDQPGRARRRPAAVRPRRWRSPRR